MVEILDKQAIKEKKLEYKRRCCCKMFSSDLPTVAILTTKIREKYQEKWEKVKFCVKASVYCNKALLKSLISEIV